MKKFVSALLVLTMVLAIATTAVAACNIKAGMWVEFKKDSPAFTEAKSSKETKNVVREGSSAWCDKVCGKYARLIVNSTSNIKRWFKVADLKEASVKAEIVIWAKGGKGMSSKVSIYPVNDYLKGKYVKVSGHTNLRKTPSLHCASQGVVEKCTLLKLTGRTGFDDRAFSTMWYEVCYKGKKVWVSMWYVQSRHDGVTKLFDKDGNRLN